MAGRDRLARPYHHAGAGIEEAKYTPSGVVCLAKLQREGYAYIRPQPLNASG